MGSVSPVAASVTLPCTTCATALLVSRRQNRENKKSLCLNTCPNDFISSCKVTNNPRITPYPHPNITTMPSNGTAKGRMKSSRQKRSTSLLLTQTANAPQDEKEINSIRKELFQRFSFIFFSKSCTQQIKNCKFATDFKSQHARWAQRKRSSTRPLWLYHSKRHMKTPKHHHIRA